MAMQLKVLKTDLQQILPFRNLFLQENNFQIRYNACHERNWTDSYLLYANDQKVGYGSVKGKEELGDRDAIFEFYITPPFRKWSRQLFAELISYSKAIFIECQSNDLILSSLLNEFAKTISSDVILFEDHLITAFKQPELVFRLRRSDDVFEKKATDTREYVLELDGIVVAVGGFLLHYNMPFADLYMEVGELYRRRGYGSFILQELKKQCYLSGRVPAARCDIKNQASKATLIKAGLGVCGYMLTGKI